MCINVYMVLPPRNLNTKCNVASFWHELPSNNFPSYWHGLYLKLSSVLDRPQAHTLLVSERLTITNSIMS